MPMQFTFPFTVAAARELTRDNPMARHIGFEPVAVDARSAVARMTIRPEHLAPNGFLHAGVVTLFADVTCGMGSFAALPDAGHFYTTLDTVTNYVGTAREGVLECTATARHVGRRSQVWDGTVQSVDSGRTLAVFRCTQMVLENR